MPLWNSVEIVYDNYKVKIHSNLEGSQVTRNLFQARPFHVEQSDTVPEVFCMWNVTAWSSESKPTFRRLGAFIIQIVCLAHSLTQEIVVIYSSEILDKNHRTMHPHIPGEKTVCSHS
jgi:hypothetical protein